MNYLTTDADLTSVADAIRTKGGTSAALAFPAEFVSAIGDIQTGGGGGGVMSGTFTPSSDVTEITIQALVGTTLTHFLFKARGILGNALSSGTRRWAASYFDFNDPTNRIDAGSNTNGASLSAISSTSSVNSAFTFDRATGTLKINPSANGGGYIGGGVTYEWFAW